MTPLSEEEAEQFYALGFAQYRGGQWKEAADVFRLLCTKRPLEGRFWFGLGAALQEAGSYSDALHAWAMTAFLKKEDPYPHFHAAECYLSLHHPKEATKALREATLRTFKEHPLEGKIAQLLERWKVTDEH